MTNKSKKYRNKKIKNLVLIGIVLLLVVSYFISRSQNKTNFDTISMIQVEEPSAHFRGNLESDIKLIEYSDFQCPACSAAELQITSLVDQYGDKFKIEYRHFPLRSIHPNAQIGAQAAEAAGMQGKFWEMHDVLFERQSEWSESINPKKYLKKYAEKIGINVDRFVYDMNSNKTKEVVDSQYNEAIDLNLPGTPSFVFNEEVVDINMFIQDNLLEKEISE